MKDKHGKEITNYDIQKEMWERCKRQAEPCEDCVSRKSLKHKLQERHDFFIDAYGGFINLPQKDKARVDAIATCIAMVVNEPPVKPTQNWIPVSERLPEENGFYLATCDGEICGENEPFTGLAEYENGKWVDDEEDYQCVLAWMPLPKPYKTEMEGEE